MKNIYGITASWVRLGEDLAISNLHVRFTTNTYTCIICNTVFNSMRVTFLTSCNNRKNLIYVYCWRNKEVESSSRSFSHQLSLLIISKFCCSLLIAIYWILPQMQCVAFDSKFTTCITFCFTSSRKTNTTWMNHLPHRMVEVKVSFSPDSRRVFRRMELSFSVSIFLILSWRLLELDVFKASYL